MGDSIYILHQNYSLYYIGNLLGLAFIAGGIYELYKRSKERYVIDEKGGKLDRIYGVIIAVLFGGWVLYAIQDNYKISKRIEKYHAETYGVTIERESAGKSSSVIKYSFTVGGKLYFGTSGYVYGGETISGIIVPKGNYKVIYNKNNPNESVMDFKAPK